MSEYAQHWSQDFGVPTETYKSELEKVKEAAFQRGYEQGRAEVTRQKVEPLLETVKRQTQTIKELREKNG